MQRTLLLLLVAASYLLLAGGRPWTLAPLLLIAAAAIAVAPRRTAHFPKDHRALDLSLIALAGGIVIQLLPLPAAVVSALSPHAQRFKDSMQFAAVAEHPAWTTLSIHPERTVTALAAVALGILSFWISRAVFGAPGSTRTFCRVLAVFACGVAIAAVIQKAATPKLLLFVVEPEARSTNPFGAFTNRNHFAAWLLLVSMPILGYQVARMRIHPPSNRRWRSALKEFLGSGAVMTAMSSVLTFGVLLLTLSRSAIIGLGVAALAWWRAGRPRLRFERTMLPARFGMVGAMLIIAMAFVDVDGWITRLEESLTAEGVFGRVTIWRETLPMVRDFWLTGTGAGTFSDAMTDYQQTRFFVASVQRWAHFNNAHSHYLQVAAEGGLLLTIPAIAAMAALWSLARRTLRADKGEMYWVRVGAVAGLAGLMAQSIWEVSLTMPANAVLTGVLGGLLLYRRDVT